jgi:hypothetical protein
MTTLVLIGLASPAAGICEQLLGDPLWDAGPDDSVFIGTAVETRAFGQNALFHVEETWVGDPLPEWQVALGTDSENTIASTNPQFEAGTRYLVVGHWDEGTLRPSGCTGTQVYSHAVAETRPADATEPIPGSRPLMWAGAWSLLSLISTILTVLVVAAILAAPLLIWRRRRAATEL